MLGTTIPLKKYTITAEFKDIDRSVELIGEPQTAGLGGGGNGLNMGCHTRLMSSVTLRADYSTIKVLSTGKPISRDSWGSIDQKESEQITKAIAGYEIDPSHRDNIFASIVKQYVDRENQIGGASHIIMSDNINSHTPAFPKNSGIADSSKVKGFKTSDFIQYLIKHKIGIVMGSPVATNPAHHGPHGNYSLTQAWIWIPPAYYDTIVPDSHFITNTGKISKWADWYKRVKTLLGKPNMDDSAVDRDLWKGGKRNSHLEFLKASGE
jgi:hypothetical protein